MRRLPDDNLAYPVLINCGNSSGSGFFINGRESIYLVTACHVLYDPNQKIYHSQEVSAISYPKENAEHEKNVLNLHLPDLESLGLIATSFEKDLAVIKFAKLIAGGNSFNLLPGANVKLLSTAGIIGVSLENIKLYKEVLIANEVFIFGYPVSLGVPNIPQIDSSRPLLRAGIVAGKNASLGSIILDCPVYPGNSGGPVVEVEQDGSVNRFRIIGLITQFVPAVASMTGPLSGNVAVNSGYSIAASMDGIVDLIDGIEQAPPNLTKQPSF